MRFWDWKWKVERTQMLTEGKMVKGGRNEVTTVPRPKPPEPQGIPNYPTCMKCRRAKVKSLKQARALRLLEGRL